MRKYGRMEAASSADVVQMNLGAREVEKDGSELHFPKRAMADSERLKI